MIIHGKITLCAPIKMEDGNTIYEVRFTDGSKPMAMRTSGEFVTYLSDDKRKEFPSGEDIDGAEFTMRAREISPGKGGTTKFKGDMVKGFVPIERFTTDDGKLPSKPASAAGK